ncbi:fimbria/pilus outer membrane usher protein [Acinetobacter defluvii]|uniref:fimbria/pilus outer membrane usher protein n=1 Tax=Acinetobacter defluvii TaxID=1871111 RepID=UPI001490377C|nr:fimbria/pilus outer membrane usher protein [Acinetobacter defluvii]
MKEYVSLKRSTLAQCIIIIFCAPSFHLHAETFSEIPDAVQTIQEIPPIKLYLDLVINSYSTQKVVTIIAVDDHYYLQKIVLNDLDINPEHFHTQQALKSEDLLHLGINSQPDEWVQLDQQSEIKTAYNASHQQILLEMPSNWLPEQQLGKDYWYKRTTAQSGMGLLNNYDIYVQKPHHQSTSYNILTEQRFFSPYGSLKNTGNFRSLKNSINQKTENDYIRYDTHWQFDSEDNIATLEIGDIYSARKNSWTQSVRLGGIQLRRNYSIRPDLITYPLPQFTGESALPSTVDLFINGLKSSTDHIQPGPYVLNSVPFINGRGEAVVVTTDAVGRQVSTTVPFYVSGDLLQPKLFDYSISAGKLRENYGIKNFDYGDLIGSFDGRYGVTPWLTAEAHAEGNNDVWNMGLGQVFKLYNFGVLNTSYSYSQANANQHNLERDVSGHQWTVGYQYQQPHFGFNALHSKQSENFKTVANYYTDGLISINAQESTVANMHFSTKKSGAFGIGYFGIKRDGFDDSELLSLSWAPVLPSELKGATLSLSANRDLKQDTWNAGVQLTIPWGQTRSYLNTGYQYQQDGRNSAYVNYNYQMPTEGGFGVNLTHRYNEGSDGYNQAQVNYRNRYFNLQAGISGDDNYDQWYGLAGSLIWMKNTIFAANRLGESFSLISTNGHANIPIRYENNLIGETNKKGYLFVPNVTPYYGAKYSIDPLNLSSNYATPVVEQRTAAKQGAGIVVDFPVKKVQAGSIYLKRENSEPLPAGAVVYQEGRQPTYVGLDSIVYIEELEKQNILKVDLGYGQSCTAQFAAELDQEQIITISDVVCR